jgi:hypothetical protein
MTVAKGRHTGAVPTPANVSFLPTYLPCKSSLSFDLVWFGLVSCRVASCRVASFRGIWTVAVTVADHNRLSVRRNDGTCHDLQVLASIRRGILPASLASTLNSTR